jgi:hypothetical protein
MTTDMAKTSPMRLEPSLHESADTTADPVDYEDAYRPLQHIEKPDGTIEIIYEDEFEKEALQDMLSVDSTLTIDDFIKADPEIPVSSPVPKWARQVLYDTILYDTTIQHSILTSYRLFAHTDVLYNRSVL